jgi:hypothetical protein
MGLDGQGSIPSGVKRFFSTPQRQAGFGTHPTFYQMGTGVLSPGQGRWGGEADQVFIMGYLINQTQRHLLIFLHAKF